MEVREILQENINAGQQGKTLFMEENSSLCDPSFGNNEPKYALFSFTPNHIQKRRNKQFVETLFLQQKVDAETRDSLVRLLGDADRTFPGVGRIRGSFHDLDAATRRAEHIVQHLDPFSAVLICHVGVPFPLVESGFAATTSLVEETADDVVRDGVAKKKAEREAAIKQMKMREKRLVEETTNPHKTPLDNYIELRVKYAQLRHTMNEMTKKFSEYGEIVSRTASDIKAVEATSPDLKETYFQAYMDACNEIGTTPPDGFLRLLRADV